MIILIWKFYFNLNLFLLYLSIKTSRFIIIIIRFLWILLNYIKLKWSVLFLKKLSRRNYEIIAITCGRFWWKFWKVETVWEAKTLNLCYSRCWLRVLTRVGPCFTFVFSFGLKFAYFPEFPGSDIETGSTLYVRNIIGNHRNRWLISFDSVFVRDFSIAIFILLFI